MLSSKSLNTGLPIMGLRVAAIQNEQLENIKGEKITDLAKIIELRNRVSKKG